MNKICSSPIKEMISSHTNEGFQQFLTSPEMEYLFSSPSCNPYNNGGLGVSNGGEESRFSVLSFSINSPSCTNYMQTESFNKTTGTQLSAEFSPSMFSPELCNKTPVKCYANRYRSPDKLHLFDNDQKSNLFNKHDLQHYHESDYITTNNIQNGTDLDPFRNSFVRNINESEFHKKSLYGRARSGSVINDSLFNSPSAFRNNSASTPHQVTDSSQPFDNRNAMAGHGRKEKNSPVYPTPSTATTSSSLTIECEGSSQEASASKRTRFQSNDSQISQRSSQGSHAFTDTTKSQQGDGTLYQMGRLPSTHNHRSEWISPMLGANTGGSMNTVSTGQPSMGTPIGYNFSRLSHKSHLDDFNLLEESPSVDPGSNNNAMHSSYDELHATDHRMYSIQRSGSHDGSNDQSPSETILFTRAPPITAPSHPNQSTNPTVGALRSGKQGINHLKRSTRDAKEDAPLVPTETVWHHSISKQGNESKSSKISPAKDKPSSFVQCKCKKSRCLKLYCDCFAALKVCNPAFCSCYDCCNVKRPHCNEARERAIQLILDRNSLAFQNKIHDEIGTHVMGCHCSKSQCLKKYCECYQAGAYCGVNCKCKLCKNVAPNPSHASIPPSKGLSLRVESPEEEDDSPRSNSRNNAKKIVEAKKLIQSPDDSMVSESTTPDSEVDANPSFESPEEQKTDIVQDKRSTLESNGLTRNPSHQGGADPITKGLELKQADTMVSFIHGGRSDLMEDSEVAADTQLTPILDSCKRRKVKFIDENGCSSNQMTSGESCVTTVDRSRKAYPTIVDIAQAIQDRIKTGKENNNQSDNNNDCSQQNISQRFLKGNILQERVVFVTTNDTSPQILYPFFGILNKCSKVIAKKKTKIRKSKKMQMVGDQQWHWMQKITALRILEYLNGKELYAMSQLNWLWYCTVMDDALWE